MPKCTMRWDFNEPEEVKDFKVRNQAWAYRFALEDFNNKIRAWIKYEERETVSLEEVKQVFYEILEDRSIEV